MAKGKQKTGIMILLALAAVGILILLSRRSAAAATPGQGGPAGSAAGNIFSGLTGLFSGFSSGANAPAASNVGTALGGAVAPGLDTIGSVEAGAGGTTPGGINPNFALPSSLGSAGIALPGAIGNDLVDLPAAVSGGGGSFASELASPTGSDTSAQSVLFANGVTFSPTAA